MSRPPDRPVSARLEELRQLREAGTPGPWRYDGGWPTIRAEASTYYGEFIAEVHKSNHGPEPAQDRPNAALIVAAVNALPALLDIAEAAAAHIEADPNGSMTENEKRMADALDRLNTEDGAGR